MDSAANLEPDPVPLLWLLNVHAVAVEWID
jgi:hypothetical protein